MNKLICISLRQYRQVCKHCTAHLPFVNWNPCSLWQKKFIYLFCQRRCVCNILISFLPLTDAFAANNFWNIVTNRNIAHREQYLLLPQCFLFYSEIFRKIKLRYQPLPTYRPFVSFCSRRLLNYCGKRRNCSVYLFFTENLLWHQKAVIENSSSPTAIN